MQTLVVGDEQLLSKDIEFLVGHCPSLKNIKFQNTGKLAILASNAQHSYPFTAILSWRGLIIVYSGNRKDCESAYIKLSIAKDCSNGWYVLVTCSLQSHNSTTK